MLFVLRHKSCSLALCVLAGCSIPGEPGLDHVASALVQEGTAALHDARFEEAQASFRVSSEAFQSAESLDGLACIRFLEGDTAGAIRLLEGVLQWYPAYAPAYANLAVIMELAGQHDAAEHYYTEALERTPLDMAVRSNYGHFLLDRGRIGEGKTFLMDAWVLSRHLKLQQTIELLARSHS